MTTQEFSGDNIRPAINCITSVKLDPNKRYELTIKEKKKRLSRDANAYFWEFLDKLAVKLRIGKTELYRELIRDIGGVSTIICVKSEAADALIDGWKHNGIGWFAEKEESKLEGCTNVVLFYGSSTYDTEQMSRLIDRLIWECNLVGIDTTDLRTKALLEVQNG